MAKKNRYAVVGLGYIAQIAVLPAFKNAKKSTLTALVSGDNAKLKKLGKKYGVKNLYSYEQFDECLRSGNIDAVYIALPNHMHRQYSEQAARAGIHVLCEKPMAISEGDCKSMIKVAEDNRIKLMIAYRLHFERANMRAVEIARSGKLGKLRVFNSSFSFQVKDKNNIRLQEEFGGGPLYDIGIYCINAARYLFRDEPLEVMAISANSGESRFKEVDEMTAAILKFPHERLANFVCSFGSADSSYYELIGTKGSLCVDSAYDYAQKITHELTLDGKTTTREYAKRDQFGPELDYFAECIQKDRKPEPSGLEGLADVRIIQALLESARTGKSVWTQAVQKKHPTLNQESRRAAVEKPDLFHVTPPEGEKNA